MFQSSPQTELLDAALAHAQSEFKRATKDQNNPFFKSKYADLSSVIDACHDALAKYEITVTQWPLHSDDNKVHLLTRVAHNGQWLQSTFSMPVTKDDPQGFKSALTYLRRSSLEAVLCIATVDDDGNAASQPPPLPKPVKNYAPQASKTPEMPKSAASAAPKAQSDDPWPEPSDMPPAFNNSEPLFDAPKSKAADYIAQVKKFRGKRIGDIPRQQLANYITFMKQEAKDKNQPISEILQEFINKCEEMWAKSPLDDDSIPF